MNDEITIILPTYNREAVLRNCVLSIINQTYPNWRLIILDDCSDDNTELIGLEYQTLHSNITFIKNETRLFQQGNKNKGINLAQTSLIYFMEDDVVLDTDCLQILYNSYVSLSHEYRMGAIAPRLSNPEILNSKMDEKIRQNPFQFDRITGDIENNYAIKGDTPINVITLHACALVPTRIIKEIGGFSSEKYIGNCYREETDFFFRIRKAGYVLFFEPKAHAIHYHVAIGGCRIPSRYKYHGYNLRNHAVFLWSFYRVKSLLMFPFFCIQYLIRRIIIIELYCLKKRRREKKN